MSPRHALLCACESSWLIPGHVRPHGGRLYIFCAGREYFLPQGVSEEALFCGAASRGPNDPRPPERWLDDMHDHAGQRDLTVSDPRASRRTSWWAPGAPARRVAARLARAQQCLHAVTPILVAGVHFSEMRQLDIMIHNDPYGRRYIQH